MKDYSRIRKITLIILMLLLALVHVAGEWKDTGDFLIYYQAAGDILQHENIFAKGYGEAYALPYYGSPVLALILAPFTLLSYPVAAAIWKLISIVLLYRIWVRMESFVDVTALSVKAYSWFIIASFLAVSFVLYRNLHLAQFTIFLLFACLEGYCLIRSGKNVPGGMLIAVGVVCKIVPLIMLPYLLYRRFFRAAGWTLVFISGLLLLPVLFIGWEQCAFLNQQWWRSINPSKSMNIFDVSTPDIHGITSLVATLLIDGVGIDKHTLTVRRHILDLPPAIVAMIIQVARAGLVLFTVYFLRTAPFVKEENREKNLWEIGYLFLVAPLVFPQQRLYAFLFLFPAVFYLNYKMALHFSIRSDRLPKRYPKAFFIYVSAVLVFNLELLVGNFREYYWHFKTVTYCALIILAIYAIYCPQKANKKKKLS